MGNFPYAIAITPDGRTAYVSNADSGTVTPITVGSYPQNIVIVP